MGWREAEESIVNCAVPAGAGVGVGEDEGVVGPWELPHPGRRRTRGREKTPRLTTPRRVFHMTSLTRSRSNHSLGGRNDLANDSGYSQRTVCGMPRLSSSPITSDAFTVCSIRWAPGAMRPRACRPIMIAACQPVSRSIAVKPVASS
jgi:hypothetical protein